MADVRRIRVGPEVVLEAPDGSDVVLREVSASFSYAAGALSRVEAHVTVDWETWLRIDAEGWFRMPADRRGPVFGGAFRAGEPVELDLLLDWGALTGMALTADNEFEGGAQIRGGRHPSTGPGEAMAPGRLNPLVGRSHSWIGLNAKQPIAPGVKAGFATVAGGWRPPGG